MTLLRTILPAAVSLLIAGYAGQGAAEGAAPAGGAGATAGQCAIDGETQRDQLDAQIHDYLTRHPEVLIEMSQALQQKQRAAFEERAKQGLAENHAALFDDPADPVAGNPKGDVTVVEFFDVQCPYCKQEAPALARLVAADPGVRLVYKDYPILDPASRAAAKAALAARAQGKYQAFHEALMADTTPEHQLTDGRILAVARTVGLDTARLKTDMAAPAVEAKIAANVDLARKIGVTGTPGLIVGGRLMPGAVPFEVLRQAVAEARKQRTDTLQP